MACWPVVEIGLAFLFRGHAHGEPPAFQAAQRGFDSLCPLHASESPDTDFLVGAFTVVKRTFWGALNALRATALVFGRIRNLVTLPRFRRGRQGFTLDYGALLACTPSTRADDFVLSGSVCLLSRFLHDVAPLGIGARSRPSNNHSNETLQ